MSIRTILFRVGSRWFALVLLEMAAHMPQNPPGLQDIDALQQWIATARMPQIPIGLPDIVALRRWSADIPPRPRIAIDNWIFRLEGIIRDIQRRRAMHVSRAMRQANNDAIVDIQRKGNKICASLRQHGASPMDACNFIAPYGNKSDRQVGIVRTGLYDTATATSNGPNDIPRPDEFIVLHRTRDRCCTVNRDMLFSWLMSVLERRACVLGLSDTAYAVFDGSRRVDQYDNPVLLLRCQCMPNAKNSRLSGHGPSMCNKRMLAADPMLVNALTPEQRDEYIAKAKEVQTQLEIQHYGERVALCCVECAHQFVDSKFVTCIRDRRPYRPTNAVCCPNPTCETRWCRVCKKAPYHDGQDCLGPPDLYRELTQDMKTPEEVVAFRLDNKPCPRCKLMTNRIDGCAHMKCTRCMTHWCWSCLMTLHPNDPYRHNCTGTGDENYIVRIGALDMPWIGLDGAPVRVRARGMGFADPDDDDDDGFVDQTLVPAPAPPLPSGGIMFGGRHYGH